MISPIPATRNSLAPPQGRHVTVMAVGGAAAQLVVWLFNALDPIGTPLGAAEGAAIATLLGALVAFVKHKG